MEISESVNTLGDLHNSSDDTKAEFNNCQISRCYYNYTAGFSLSTKECTRLFQQFFKLSLCFISRPRNLKNVGHTKYLHCPLPNDFLGHNSNFSYCATIIFRTPAIGVDVHIILSESKAFSL